MAIFVEFYAFKCIFNLDKAKLYISNDDCIELLFRGTMRTNFILRKSEKNPLKGFKKNHDNLTKICKEQIYHFFCIKKVGIV